MHLLRITLRVALGLAALALDTTPSLAQQGKRYAILVGPKTYDHSKLGPLDYTENDVAELYQLLPGARYEVALLTDTAGRKDKRYSPTKANIMARLHEMLGKCKRKDLVVVAFAGHGLQFDKDADCYFCPRDAKPFADQTGTLISLDGVYKALDRCGAGAKVLLADCCRIDPAGGRGRDVANDVLDKNPPKGVYAFFSCSKGERAFEHQALKHRVFFHHVIEGLKGRVKDAEGEVTFEALTLYVRRQVPAEVRRLFGSGVKQTPNLKAVDVSGEPLVLVQGDGLLAADVAAVWRGLMSGKIAAVYVHEVGRERVGAWRRAAEEGSPQGQYLFAKALELGAGVGKDLEKAVWWYRKAANQGYALAEDTLGWCYDRGLGVGKDAREAVRWYRKAAEQDCAVVEDNLGWCYDRGFGVAKDSGEAVRWFRKAAEQGYAIAENNLGWRYDSGLGVGKDAREAVRWYRKAAEQGYPLAENNLGWCYVRGFGVPKDAREAVRWYRKAAKHGNALAECNLGNCYIRGTGVAKNAREAVHWYRKAAKHGNAAAENNLGWCYEKGKGVKKNKRKAVRWYRKAAAHGNRDAKKALRRVSKSR
jgi:TPR repeat protein